MPQRRLIQRLDPFAATIIQQGENWRALLSRPARWAYEMSDQQAVIDADVARWGEVLGVADGTCTQESLFYAFPEFRSVFYHRLAKGNPTGALAGRVAQRVWKGVPGLDLTACNAEPGLFVSHGQGTVLSAERIGANCFVHQGVTVGWDYRSERLPRIGDNVFIGTGAKILGAVTVGDGARIGANAVVLRNVPPGATAVGVPARLLLEGREDRRARLPTGAPDGEQSAVLMSQDE